MDWRWLRQVIPCESKSEVHRIAPASLSSAVAVPEAMSQKQWCTWQHGSVSIEYGRTWHQNVARGALILPHKYWRIHFHESTRGRWNNKIWIIQPDPDLCRPLPVLLPSSLSRVQHMNLYLPPPLASPPAAPPCTWMCPAAPCGDLECLKSGANHCCLYF